eukprot:scpid33168/ scgid15310/ Semaphorin-1A; Fasciclin IV; Fasciclin-4; Semaphorin-I
MDWTLLLGGRLSRSTCTTVLFTAVVVAASLLCVSAKGPVLEWAKEREECTASQTDGVGSVRVWSFKKMTKNAEQFRVLRNAELNFSNIIFSDDSIIVGASDFILHIDVNYPLFFRIRQAIHIPPSQHQRQVCLRNGMSETECRNHNQVLGFSPVNNTRYLECGTGAVKPYCNWRKVSNGDIINYPTPAAEKVCPYLPRVSSAMLIGNDTVFAGTFSVLEEAMITRSFPSLSTLQDTLWLDDPQFIDSFEHGDFVYMVLREVAHEVTSESKVVSRIVRFCKRDPGVGEVFRSFLKLRMVCRNGDPDTFTFDLVTKVVLAMGSIDNPDEREMLLYATFHLPPGAPQGSAVCAYPLRDIVEKFNTSPFIYNQGNNIWLEREREPDIEQCRKTSMTPDSQTYLYLKEQLSGNAIIMLERIGLTSLAILDADPYDVLFLGTDSGEVLKATRVLSTDKAAKYRHQAPRYRTLVIDRIKVANSSVNKLLTSAKLTLIAMTNDDFVRLPIVGCYWHATSCFSCVQTRDPYCGWCPDPFHDSGGTCIPRLTCNARKSNGSIGYFQDVEHGNTDICGPVVTIKNENKESIFFVNVNEEINITLHVRHASSVIWRRGVLDDLHTLSNKRRFTRTHKPSENIATLTISPAVLKDKGPYTVVAKNNISQATETIELAVVSKAQIISHPKDLLVAPGSPAMFECRLKKRTGTDSIILHWLYCRDVGSKPCRPDSMTRVNAGSNIIITNANSLVILNAQSANVGQYRCEVRKDNTNVLSDIARLDIKKYHKMVEGSMEIFVPIIQEACNASLKLHCANTGCSPADDSNSSSSSSEARKRRVWKYNNREMESESSSVRTSRSRCRSAIHLSTPIMAGTYTCQLDAATTTTCQTQAPPSSTAVTSFYVMHDASLSARQLRLVIHCEPQEESYRHTISCPAKKTADKASKAKWAEALPPPPPMTPNSTESTPTQDEASPAASVMSSAYTVTKSGDLRITQCATMPDRTELLCWMNEEEKYSITLETTMID